MRLSSSLAGLALVGQACLAAPERQVIPAGGTAKTVDRALMQTVYEQIKTPFKYGVVVPAPAGKKTDCPSVFRHGGRWYMVYIVFDDQGYETLLAVSDDLLRWSTLGRIMSRRGTGWDANQAAGYIALQDHRFGGSHALAPFEGRYWLSYIGGALKGYETDPLAIGIAHTDDPTQVKEWDRLPAAVLSRDQPDVRAWEKLTQYKSNIIWDRDERLGYPFVMYYNAKSKSGYERIGMAVSRDLRTWLRYGAEPIVDNGSGISGDPQVVRLGELWVMFYFGAFYKPKAFDTFACSHDMVHWTKWDGPHLVEPSVPYDATYAHKPWVVSHGGVVYHFYNAVGNQGRCIALATSHDLR